MWWIVIILLQMADKNFEMGKLGNKPKKWNIQNCMYQTKLTHQNVNMVHNPLNVLGLIECHHQDSEVVSKHVGDCVSTVFTFQCMWVWFDKLCFATCMVHTILKLLMHNRQDWHSVLRTSRLPDDSIQEVSKHVRDCILCSHFSVCKVGLINWNIQSKAGIHLVRQRW